MGNNNTLIGREMKRAVVKIKREKTRERERCIHAHLASIELVTLSVEERAGRGEGLRIKKVQKWKKKERISFKKPKQAKINIKG